MLSILSVFTDEFISAMPRPLRAIAGYTYDAAMSFCPAQVTQLVGGFILLRFICPAIVSPDSFRILPVDAPVTESARRNLVLITKVLQTLSNGVLGEKETYMLSLRPFFEEKRYGGQSLMDVMKTFLVKIATDPLYENNELPSSWADLEQPSGNDVDITLIDRKDLFEFHRILYNLLPKLKQYLSEAQSQDSQEFVKTLSLLSPPPCSMPLTSENTEEEVTSVNIAASKTMDEKYFQNFENSKFFYQGPVGLDNTAIFYLILSRMNSAHIFSLAYLYEYMYKVMEQSASIGKFSIVVDCSWYPHVFDEKKTMLFGSASAFCQKFPLSFSERLSKVIIVHPNSFTKKFVRVIKTLFSEAASSKIVEIYNWKQLNVYIKPSNISLPDESKGFITKSYTALKVNAKGKRQERLIKFTVDSFLNIDPRSHEIKNETKITDIFAMFSEVNSPELVLVFTAEKISRSTKSFLEDEMDKTRRRYIFETVSKRDDLLVDIFEAIFDDYILQKSNKAKLQQEFNVTKINNRGKHQERIQKLTSDSILNISGSTIKTEIPISGIESVSFKQNEVVLKLKSEDFVRRFKTLEAESMCTVIQSRLSLYKTRNEERANGFNVKQTTPTSNASVPQRRLALVSKQTKSATFHQPSSFRQYQQSPSHSLSPTLGVPRHLSSQPQQSLYEQQQLQQQHFQYFTQQSHSNGQIAPHHQLSPSSAAQPQQAPPQQQCQPRFSPQAQPYQNCQGVPSSGLAAHQQLASQRPQMQQCQVSPQAFPQQPRQGAPRVPPVLQSRSPPLRRQDAYQQRPLPAQSQSRQEFVGTPLQPRISSSNDLAHSSQYYQQQQQRSQGLPNVQSVQCFPLQSQQQPFSQQFRQPPQQAPQYQQNPYI